MQNARSPRGARRGERRQEPTQLPAESGKTRRASTGLLQAARSPTAPRRLCWDRALLPAGPGHPRGPLMAHSRPSRRSPTGNGGQISKDGKGEERRGEGGERKEDENGADPTSCPKASPSEAAGIASAMKPKIRRLPPCSFLRVKKKKKKLFADWTLLRSSGCQNTAHKTQFHAHTHTHTK